MHKFRIGDRVRIVLEGNVTRIDEDGVNFKDYRTGELHYWAFDDCELVDAAKGHAEQPEEQHD